MDAGLSRGGEAAVSALAESPGAHAAAAGSIWRKGRRPLRARGGKTSFLLISRVTLWYPSLSVPSEGLVWAAAVCPVLVAAQRCFCVEPPKRLLLGTCLFLAQPCPAAKTTSTHLQPLDLGVGASQ